MDSVNKTLYIPLYGKAQVSAKGILLDDPKAEEKSLGRCTGFMNTEKHLIEVLRLSFGFIKGLL